MIRKTLSTILLLCAIPLYISAQSRDTTQITERTHPIDEVVVTGSRSEADIRLLPTTVSVVDRQQIEQDIRPSLLPTLAEQVPGLFISSRGVMGYGVSSGAAGGMSIRGIGGSPTTGVMVLIDGHPQYMGLMGHPIADAYQSQIAERVEVVRGPASMLYGSNAMGGVMNIITRKMQQDGIKTNARLGYGSYNTLESDLTNRIRLGDFSSTITGSYNRSDGHRTNMGFEQYGGSAQLGLRIGENWDVSSGVNITHFNASNPGTLSAPLLDNDSRITRGSASLSLKNEFDIASGALSLFYNWGQHRINDGYSPDEQPLDSRFFSRDEMMGLTWYQTFAIMSGNQTTVGIDYQHYGGKAETRYINNEPTKTIADKQMDNVAAYANMSQNLTRWLAMNVGLRLDYNSIIGKEWIPQGGISIQLPKQTQIKTIVSKGFRFPTIREMYMFPPQNPDLKPERLMNYELSVRKHFSTISVGANIFYIEGENLIQTLFVDGRPMNLNTGQIENYGIEADLLWMVSPRWTLSSNYSFLDMKHRVVAAPRHKFFASATYSYGKWSASTSIQLIRDLATQTSPLVEENYMLWNCNATFRASNRIELYVRAENLLAQHYEVLSGYPMPRATIFAGVKFSL